MIGTLAVTGTAMALGDDAQQSNNESSNNTVSSQTAQQPETAAVPAADGGSVVLKEDFKGSSVSDDRWQAFGDACLTAATQSTSGTTLGSCTKTADTGSIQSQSTGLLQLTDNSESSNGTVLYNRAVPVSAGLDISFYQYQVTTSSNDRNHYGIGKADGIGFFLTKGTEELTKTGPVGSDVGGALGYATYAGHDGIDNGVLGLGLDVYGNFSTNNASGENCNDGTGSDRSENNVVLRGEGNGTTGYCLVGKASAGDNLQTNLPKVGSSYDNDQSGRLVRIVITPQTDDTNSTVTVYLDNDEKFSQTLNYRLPDTVKFGFTSSTGRGHQAHLIRGLTASTVDPVPGIMLNKEVTDEKSSYEVGDKVNYKFTITNSGLDPLSSVTLTDEKLDANSLQCEETPSAQDPLQPASGYTCTGTHTLTADDIAEDGTFTNNATVTGTPVNGGEGVTDTDTATVNVTKPLGPPAHNKRIKKNEDGSYTLNLDVTGDSSQTTTTTTQPLDIALVLDVSGSMAENLDDTYTKAYNPSTSGTYYVLVNGTYQRLSYSRNSGWYYGNRNNRQYVTPKMSANDTDTSHTQFYSHMKIDALKSAVADFINATAEQNAKISDPNKKHHVSLIKFASNEREIVGNDTNSSGYNYSQTLNNLQEVNSSTAASMISDMNNISAAGATQADYGLELAKSQFDSSAREGAKKVVIFFTDGEPTSGSSFENSVAKNAIDAAGKLKANDTTIYSIGVFKDADPSKTSTSANNKFNAYMHAVSSNYPNATATSSNSSINFDLGQRAPNSDYYKAATSADELSKIFDDIQTSITTGSAYSNVTIEDMLSDYAEFDFDLDNLASDDVTVTASDGSKVDVQNITVDKATKKVTVEFNGELKKGVTYTVSFKIKPSDKAFTDKATNLEQDNNNGYGTTTGEADTDIADNDTSSNKPGFYSNSTAQVCYSADGKDNQCADYQKPVLQVELGKITVTKEWDSEPTDTPEVKVDLHTDSVTGDVVKTITLQKNEEGQLTGSFDNLAPGTYYVTEQAVNGYTPSYDPTNQAIELMISKDHKDQVTDGNITITNKHSTVTLTGDTALGLVKKVSGHDWNGKSDFSFTLTCKASDTNKCADVKGLTAGQNGTYTMTASTNGEIEQNGNGQPVSFGDLTLPAGTYEFTLTENSTDKPAAGWAYDTKTVKVKVVVFEKNGMLAATVTYDDKEDKPIFTNTWIAVSSLPLTGGSTGRDWLLAGGGLGVLALLAGASYFVWRKRRLV